MAKKLNPKKLVDKFVDEGGAIVVYPWAEEPTDRVGPFGVGYAAWLPGALRWFQLGGSDGHHVHTTKYTKIEAAHRLGVWLYDGGRRVAYVCPLVEAGYDDGELSALLQQVASRDAALKNKEGLEEFLRFFEEA